MAAIEFFRALFSLGLQYPHNNNLFANCLLRFGSGNMLYDSILTENKYKISKRNGYILLHMK